MRAHGRLLAWIATFFLVLPILSRAQAPLPGWTADSAKTWFNAFPTPTTWPAGANVLQAHLAADYKQNGAACFSEPDFQGWMEHLEWIRLGLASPDVLAKPADLQTFIALGEDPTVSHLLVEKMVARTVRPKALENLIRLAQANMADLHEYAALGVAYSLVFDEPFPAYWPHWQVDPSAVPKGDLDIVKRFQFYVAANRAKKTDLDLTQLRVEDLKFLVDSEAKLSEFEYAQTNRIPFEQFGNAFFSIRYDTSRVNEQNQVFKWTGPTYTLADIEKNGGICVDQAYYASTLGKGRGIPTIYFTGQGSDGGHAWFGYLSKSGKWNLDCGRYASQNYPKGYALDPLDWQVVNDTTLENLAKNNASDATYQAAKTALAWAQLNAGTPAYRQILDDARTLLPTLAETWQDEGDSLDKSNAPIQDRKTFYQNWISQFQNYPDMRVEGQKRLLAALKGTDDPDANSLQQDIVLQNRRTGFDLGVQGSVGAIEDAFKAQDWDGAKVKFETSVKDFKDQGGGTFFNNVIEPYVMMCLEYGRADQAEDGLHYTEERMPMTEGSILAIEFEKLKNNIKVVKDAFPAAEKWMGELDDGDYAQAWSDESKLFQSRAPSDQFVAYMNAKRKPFGKCSSRAMSEAPAMGDQLTLSTGKSLQGEFITLQYTGTFENNTTAAERITMSQEDDGTWRTLFYGITKK